MSISNVVDWWEEWQLRILVLGSLAIQLYLAVVAPFRKWTGLKYPNRLLIWVFYLGVDALAIYALATLFNRQKRLQHHTSSSIDASHDLEVLWAPILLMHLGGRMTISAYNIEDNELWLRHVGVAMSQVTVTVYVFWTTWSPSADKKLFAAAVVLFILGSVRCFEKPLALRRASFNNLATYFISVPRIEISTNREVELEKYIQDARFYYMQVQSSSSSNNQQQQQQQQQQDDPAASTTPEEEAEKEKQSRMEELSAPDKLFVDYAYAYGERLKKLKSLRPLHPKSAFKALRGGLSKTFNLVYTKIWRFWNENRALTPTWVDYLSLVLLEITMTFPIASIVLFHISHKEAYRGSDIKVTYLLLYITYFSELISVPARLAFSELISVPAILAFLRSRRWSRTSSLFQYCSEVLGTVALSLVCLPPYPFVKVEQHSLIGVLADKNRKFLAASIAEGGHKICCCTGCQDLLQQRWFGRRQLFRKGEDIVNLVIAHAEDAWKNQIEDVESYWKRSDSRGHWTLERNGCQDIVILWDSLEKPFDESVILWHLATDLCFHCKGASVDPEPANLCQMISNYMMYLLCANAEMLLPGSRTSLFKDACNELDGILKTEDDRHLTLTEKVISKAAKSEKGSLLHDAWVLAQGLMQLPPGGDGGDDDADGGKKMWKVIKGVWVEMLCFSAGRCRGYLHVKNLAYGGELLTYVALLMSNAGLETFADRQQRMQLRLSKKERLERAERTAGQDTGNQAAGTVVLLEEENAATPSTPSASASASASASTQGECTTAPALEVVVVEAV